MLWGVCMMTLKNCYDGIGDYDTITALFRGEDRIKKFLRIFVEDDNFQKLTKALEEDNVDAGFVAAHTLKGMCQNLALTSLYEADVEVTEALRAKNLSLAKEKYPKVKEEYNKVCEHIFKTLD